MGQLDETIRKNGKVYELWDNTYEDEYGITAGSFDLLEVLPDGSKKQISPNNYRLASWEALSFIPKEGKHVVCKECGHTYFKEKKERAKRKTI